MKVEVSELKDLILANISKDGLSQDIVETCKVVDSARKDLFKQGGYGYARAYANVWHVFLERIGIEVGLLDDDCKVPTLSGSLYRQVQERGIHERVVELFFTQAYTMNSIALGFTEGYMKLSYQGRQVEICAILEAVYEARKTCKRAAGSLSTPLEETAIHALKILLNTHYVALLTEAQRTDVAQEQSNRLAVIIDQLEKAGVNVICADVDTLYVNGLKEYTIDEIASDINDWFGFLVHTEHHGRCLFENVKKYALNIRGEVKGYKENN